MANAPQADTKCFACGKPARVSILLAEGPSNEDTAKNRVYLPNQHTRAWGQEHPDAATTSEHWFCLLCMRALEDSFRATLLYLQAENGLVTPLPIGGE